MGRLLDRRLIAIVLVVLALFLAALLAPHPTVSQVREWADSVGPAFPLVFFLVHSIVTVAPFPRTVFTSSAADGGTRRSRSALRTRPGRSWRSAATKGTRPSSRARLSSVPISRLHYW